MIDDEKFWLRAVRLNMSKINLSFQIENLYLLPEHTDEEILDRFPWLTNEAVVTYSE